MKLDPLDTAQPLWLLYINKQLSSTIIKHLLSSDFKLSIDILCFTFFVRGCVCKVFLETGKTGKKFNKIKQNDI